MSAPNNNDDKKDGASSSFSTTSNIKDINNSNKADKDCTSWRSKGKCNKYKKDKCPYRHDESVRLAAIERNRQKMIFDTQINNNNRGKKRKQQKLQNDRHPLGIVLAEGGQCDEPKVYTINGRRRIAPYYIIVSLPLQKYAGKTIQEAINSLSTRTKRPSKEYWERSLREGKLTLYESNNNNNNSSSNNSDGGSSEIMGGYKCIANPTHIIEKQNVLKGKYHYHEESIPSTIISQQQLSIVYQDDEYIVCNKPSGVDVCTNINAGRIYNSLPGLLHTEFGTANAIYPAHRIDNNVSGIVCFGKTVTAQKRLSRRIKFHEAQKTYYARVQLSLKNDNNEATSSSTLEQLHQQIQQLQRQIPIVIDVPLGFDTDTCLAFTTTAATSGDNNTHAAEEKVKECKTTIISITAHPSSDGTAIVQVQPNTGRPHQLRKHLQHVNLCIANDERYGGSTKRTTALGSDDTDATTSTGEMKGYEDSNNKDDEEALGLLTYSSSQPYKNDESTVNSVSASLLEEIQSSTFDKDCSSCMNPSSHSNNSNSSGSGIWLHSFRYEFPSLNLTFETPIPDWVRY